MAKAKKPEGPVVTAEQVGSILKELEMLRKLKMVELFGRGYSQAQLAQVLGVSRPTVSRMIPNVLPKKVQTHESKDIGS